MNNRNNKPKKSSKLKHTINYDRPSYISPSRFGTVTTLSSGCHPKQPPNVSHHYLQKKQQEIKGEYYISGKENKGRVMNYGNHVSDQKEQYVLETTDRFREKRNTHQFITYETKHHKIADVEKSHYYNAAPNYESNNLKTLTRTAKDHNREMVRDPIRLKSIKVTKLLKHSEKQPKAERQERTFKRELKQKASMIAQNEQCHLRCFENLSTYSIMHSKVSSNYIGESMHFPNDESSVMIGTCMMIQSVEKQPSIKSKKGFHKSPRILSPTTVFKTPEKTPEQEIAEFESRINQININFEHDSLHYIKTKDEKFVRSKNLNKYLDNQQHLDWKKRAMVINWMIEVLAETGGKRQTLANAVNIFDRYLSLTLNIPLDHVQCTAVASLLISAKLQDKSLSASYLSQTTLNKYSAEQIMDQEDKVFKKLNFEVNTPTLNSWVNRLAVHWDIYLDNVDLRGFDIILNNLHLIKFKTSDQTSYYNFRWLCQYVDFAVMDIFTLRYQPRMLALAFIYLILVMRLNLHSKEKVINVFPNSSQFLLEKSLFNDFFAKFLKDSFSHQLHDLLDLLPNIQYGATFAILPLKFDLPETVPDADQTDQEVHYEFFCSYQTKNQHMLASLYNRNRNVI